MTSCSDSMNFEINNPQGVLDNESEESPIESKMTEDKRQSAGTGVPTTTTRRGDISCINGLHEGNQKRTERNPVSYTHLDVYKRQVSNNLMRKYIKCTDI